MIDALFGSKTRVKLLHLFLNNPGKAFYVREMTRLIGEQINSVRRELANMLEVGIITSQNTDNKLYYEVNQRFDFYVPLRAIFADQKGEIVIKGSKDTADWQSAIKSLAGLRIAVLAGALVEGSASGVDLLLVGTMRDSQLTSVIKSIEADTGHELAYSVLSYDEFYYRLSVRDKFINDILTNKHSVLSDSDGILNNK